MFIIPTAMHTSGTLSVNIYLHLALNALAATIQSSYKRLWLCRRMAKMLPFNGNLYSLGILVGKGVKNNLLKVKCETWAKSHDLKCDDLLWSQPWLTIGRRTTTTSDIRPFTLNWKTINQLAYNHRCLNGCIHKPFQVCTIFIMQESFHFF